MSDEIKKAEMTSEEAFSEEIKRRLAEPDSGKPSLEEFKLMVYKDRERRRKRRNAAVAGIVVALLAGFFAFDTLAPEVGADKNPKEEIITEDGVIIEDGGWGSSEEEDNVFVIDDWKYIEDVKTVDSRIAIPTYITENYSFQEAYIEILETGMVVSTFAYENSIDKQVIEIEQLMWDSRLTSSEVQNIEHIIVSKVGTIYVQDGEKKVATLQKGEDTVITIWCTLPDDEIRKIAEGL